MIFLTGTASASPTALPSWVSSLKASIAPLEKEYPSQFGLYVKDLSRGEAFAYKGEENWYLASGVKVPIALEVLRRVDAGKLSLETPVLLTESDLVDGAGNTSRRKLGTRIPVRELLEQMIVSSDNTATDLLVKLVGIENVNQNLKHWVAEGFSRITSLADVRRHVYGAFHPLAFQLEGRQLLDLKRAGSESRKLAALAGMIEVKQKELSHTSLKEAYDRYYASHLNSGSLLAYGQLLEKLAGPASKNRPLQEKSARYLLETMSRVKTGRRRIKAGLPEGFVFAHKTGTQFQRACDLGIAWNPKDQHGHRVVIAACTRGIQKLAHAETAMRRLAQLVSSSGIFGRTDIAP